MGESNENQNNSLSEAIKASAKIDCTSLQQLANDLIDSIKLDPPTYIDSKTIKRFTECSSYLSDYYKEITLDDVVLNHDSLKSSIIDISDSIAELSKIAAEPVPYIQYEDIHFHGIPPIDLTHLDLPPIDIEPLVESAKNAGEALTPEPNKPYTEQKAEAAIPKLVDFANQFGKVTKVIVTVAVQTDSGAQVMKGVTLTREQAMTSLAVDQALAAAEPMPVGLPPPPPPAEDLVTLGSYARTFISKVDRRTRTITFSDGRKKPLKALEGRAEAWATLEFLLTNGTIEEDGWVDQPEHLSKWSADFRVPVKPDPHGNQMADPRHDMTKLRHHIESTAKQGRPKSYQSESVRLRFLPTINHKTYDPVLTEYKNALARVKKRASKGK